MSNGGDPTVGGRLPKLAYYRVYVRHAYGTDALIVSMAWRGRSVDKAAVLAYDRAMRVGMNGGARADVSIADVVPMRYVDGVLTETRRMRRVNGRFVNTRRAKARASVRQTRRD